MRLNSVRELKQAIFDDVLSPARLQKLARAAGVAAKPLPAATHARLIALGIAPRGENDYALAVRVQNPGLVGSPAVAEIVAAARNETEVRFIGRVQKLPAAAGEEAAEPAWQQKRVRPLKIGVSVGHYQITAGTLGCLVKSTGAGAAGTLILSNNHVLANENLAKPGDTILQPGAYDGGRNPADLVAKLERFVQLQTAETNIVDCAAAMLAEGIEFDASLITGLGNLAGAGDLHADPLVAKFGRTTGLTQGRITAFEMDNVVVGYDAADLRFDDQVEVESTGAGPFSQGGDSGSMIVNGSRQAVALLFAGSDTGGSNGLGLTYANPFAEVLKRLEVTLP
jgi:hypothetical protein